MAAAAAAAPAMAILRTAARRWTGSGSTGGFDCAVFTVSDLSQSNVLRNQRWSFKCLKKSTLIAPLNRRLPHSAILAIGFVLNCFEKN
jgi:hypothetical protein